MLFFVCACSVLLFYARRSSTSVVGFAEFKETWHVFLCHTRFDDFENIAATGGSSSIRQQWTVEGKRSIRRSTPPSQSNVDDGAGINMKLRSKRSKDAEKRIESMGGLEVMSTLCVVAASLGAGRLDC